MSFDPTYRELCPDGSCIGVIGPDGCCKECGAVAPSVTTHPRLRGMHGADDDTIAPLEGDDGERELCPDGGCIGIIGPDGRCKECGTPAAGAPVREAGARGAEGAQRPADEVGASDDGGSAGDFDDRRLCPDGSCVGIIGLDGRCKECGTPAE